MASSPSHHDMSSFEQLLSIMDNCDVRGQDKQGMPPVAIDIFQQLVEDKIMTIQ
jgi:hypothetical protein